VETKRKRPKQKRKQEEAERKQSYLIFTQLKLFLTLREEAERKS